MIGSLFTLVPERVKFESFWQEIRKRNKWLIKLRYLASLLLLSFLLLSIIAKNYYPLLGIPTHYILLIAIAIFLYNVIFHFLWIKFPDISKKYRVHSLHFSLLQIITDFVFLILLIYFTGGVESPFNTFFVFHLIIGSLILPGTIISLIMIITIGVLVSLAILEFNQVIPHYHIAGIIKYPLYNDPIYLFVFFSTFSIVVFVSIYLANSIAKVLYQREKELYFAYKGLEEAEKTKSRYVMTVVHDLKTPISAALTWVDLIANNSVGEVPEYLRNPIERIQARLKNALNLIGDILKITQVKLSSEIEKDEVDLVQLFNELYTKHRILIISKNLDYRLLPYQEKILINSNLKLLDLAFSNIISNAIKYNEPGGIIEIRITDSGKYLDISFADNGIGIPENELPKIFNEFYRSSSAKEKNIEGTGLGMALVKEIITKLGGEISINSPSYLASEGRKGTAVLVRLPK
ncbi:MAG: HAMP domain-containing histidine kinase [Ignavibacteria bacterium]|nr:HAMP domain-containing histidine kinase [Ignavibacteria bacterium]